MRNEQNDTGPSINASTSAAFVPPQHVLLVDDHAMFRDGLALLLRQLDPTVRVSHAGSLAAATRSLDEGGRPDLILCDIGLPDAQGLTPVRTLSALVQDVPVVVVSATDDASFIHQCISEGASGYVPKSQDHVALRKALDCILNGGTYLPEIATATASQALPIDGIHSLLTPRQLEVLELVRCGYPNKRIAQRLDIEAETVKKHLQAIMQRLDVHNRTEAVYAVARLQADERARAAAVGEPATRR